MWRNIMLTKDQLMKFLYNSDGTSRNSWAIQKSKVKISPEIYDQEYSKNKNYSGPNDIFGVVLNWIRKIKPTKIIEFGCGIGELANEIHKQNPSVEYTGYDYSNIAIQRAKKLDLPPSFKFEVKDIENDLLTTDSIYISTQTLEHLSLPSGDIDVIKKIPVGSTFIFSVPLNSPGKHHLHVYESLKHITKKFSSIISIKQSKVLNNRIVIYSIRSGN